MRTRDDGQVRPLHRGVQKCTRRAHPAAVVDRALGVVDAELAFPIVVRIARNAETDRARNERVGQWMMLVDIGNGQSALAPAERVIPLPDAALQPLEIRKHVGVTPAAVAALRPAIIVEPLAAIVDVPVDRARSAERLAARREDSPPAGPLARLLRVEPVQARLMEQLDEAGRDVDVGMPIARACFEHTDAYALLLAQAVGKDAARRPRADNDVIERVHRLLAHVPFRKTGSHPGSRPGHAFSGHAYSAATAVGNV